MTSRAVSIVDHPVSWVDVTRRVGRCSAAVMPRWAALIRRAASLDTIVVGPRSAWPRAAPMMRLSELAGSSPCSTRRCLRIPLISICRLPPPSGTGSASEPPWRTRSSSIVRSAVRAARPTSSGRVFNPSSSSTTVSGITTSLSSNDVTHDGSAMSTDVSRTTRVRRVELGSVPLTSDRDESGGQEIGHRHSLGWVQGRRCAVRNGALLYRSGGARWWMAGVRQDDARAGLPLLCHRRRRRRRCRRGVPRRRRGGVPGPAAAVPGPRARRARPSRRHAAGPRRRRRRPVLLGRATHRGRRSRRRSARRARSSR